MCEAIVYEIAGVSWCYVMLMAFIWEGNSLKVSSLCVVPTGRA